MLRLEHPAAALPGISPSSLANSDRRRTCRNVGRSSCHCAFSSCVTAGVTDHAHTHMSKETLMIHNHLRRAAWCVVLLLAAIVVPGPVASAYLAQRSPTASILAMPLAPGEQSPRLWRRQTRGV